VLQTQRLSAIVKIPERPRNPDFPAPEGRIFYAYARLWIIPKKYAPWCGREKTPFTCLVPSSRRDAPGQIAFRFLKKIADGRVAIAHHSPVWDGRWSEWAELAPVSTTKPDAGQRDTLLPILAPMRKQ
jgi:hypothetical protein